MDLEPFLEKLDGVVAHNGYYAAQCPAHDDNNQSLSVTEGEDGRIVLKCHAGCHVSGIMASLGLSMRDLFPGSGGVAGEPEAIYDYTDEGGNVLFQSIRFPGKKFRQRHYDPKSPDARDGWVWDLDGVRRVPYHLPEVIQGVLSGRGIWIAEGEKDADALRLSGAISSCNPMGAGKWREEYSPFFTGAHVTIIAHRDEPGRAHAERVKEFLLPYATRIRILQAREGNDAADHLAAGLGLEDFVPIRHGPRRGIVTSQQMAEAGLEHLEKSAHDTPGYGFINDVPIVARQGRMYALGAYTGDGKTTFGLQATRTLCSQGVSTGYFTLEMPEADLRSVLLCHMGIPRICIEEPWRLRESPKLLALYHAALEQLAEWKLDIIFDTRITSKQVTDIVQDREYEFVVIDHIHRFGWGDRRSFETEIQAMTNIALENNIPVLMLCQLRKSPRGRDLAAFPRPTIMEFRETSIIGDDASIAMALWRQRDESGMHYIGKTSELIILKNRHYTSREDAAGHSFWLDFDSSNQMFSAQGGARVESMETNQGSVSDTETAWEDL